MTSLEIRSLKELSEKTVKQLFKHNYNQLKYGSLHLSNNNKIILVFLLKLVDESIEIESSVSDLKTVLMYNDLNFVKTLRTEEISVDWIN